jgi:hypothetical protein
VSGVEKKILTFKVGRFILQKLETSFECTYGIHPTVQMPQQHILAEASVGL